MERPISFWGYKEQESKLILPEHDDNDDDKDRHLIALKFGSEASVLKKREEQRLEAA